MQLKPVERGDPADGIGRMSIDKQFHGGLTGTSLGEMLAAMGQAEGSAGYVAMERVKGTVHGRSGEFVLQHLGALDRGADFLEVRVVPDTGTDGLMGIRGTMTIDAARDHAYVFDYELPDRP